MQTHPKLLTSNVANFVDPVQRVESAGNQLLVDLGQSSELLRVIRERESHHCFLVLELFQSGVQSLKQWN